MQQQIDTSHRKYVPDREYVPDEMLPENEWIQVPLGPSDAVMQVLASYGDTTGRASRSELWWWVAFVAVFLPGVNLLSRMVGLAEAWVFVAGLLLIPSLCVVIRRAHDAGYTAWWLLLALTGVGIPVVAYILVRPSEPGANDWGDRPNMLRVD